MERTRKISPRRLLVAVAAATAMVVAVANPAAADMLPNNTSVSAQGTGDFIRIGGTTIELEPDPTDTCGDNDPTILTADVGVEVNNVAPLTNIQATFDSGEVEDTGICALIVIENTPAGTQTQTGVGTGSVAINNPAPDIRVDLDNGCVIDVGLVPLSGAITGTGPWDLSLGGEDFNVPAVQVVGDCNFIEAGIINLVLGLPEDDTEALLTFDVS